MKFESFKFIFGNSIHEIFEEGTFALAGQANEVTAVMTLNNLDIAIRAFENETVILEMENLRFVCTNLLMQPQNRSIVMTVNSTAEAA